MFPLNVVAAGKLIVDVRTITAGQDATNTGYALGATPIGSIDPAGQIFNNSPLFAMVSRVATPEVLLTFNGAFPDDDRYLSSVEISGLWAGVDESRTFIRSDATYTQPGGVISSWSWSVNTDQWTDATDYIVTFKRR